MIRYGRAPWGDRFPASRVPSYPRFRGLRAGQAGEAVDVVDVVIIGGGLTGCAVAYALGAAGIKAVLLEADRIGRGNSLAAAGWISDDPGVPFAEAANLLGVRVARHGFEAWRRAALDFEALLRRLDIKCYLEPHTALTIAMTPEQTQRLKKERKVRLEAGLDAPGLGSRVVTSEVALSPTLALRGREGATIDPYRACVGLAAAAEERGAKLFERSPVKRITFNRKVADVFTADGAIRTRKVIVATGLPTTQLHKSLRRHFWFRTTYVALTEPVPAKVRHQLGKRATVVRDSADPYHVVRWLDDERLMVMGADTESPPERQKEKVIVQRTGQLMYELSVLYPDISGIQPAYGWSVDYARTAEGLPYIGSHRNFPHHLFAFGDSSHSVTGAYLASRILLRYVLDELESADKAFEFNR
jgi:glycine/D-amino acid oxidase-like deaminating enzyme